MMARSPPKAPPCRSPPRYPAAPCTGSLAALSARLRRLRRREDGGADARAARRARRQRLPPAEAPAPKTAELESPTDELDPREDLRRHGQDELRRLRDHARRQARAEDRRLVQVARRPEVLRRHELPPDRPRLRDPGRRPAAQRHRRPRLPGGRDAAEGLQLRLGRRRDGQGRRRTAGASGSQFFVVTGADAAQLPPDYALLGDVSSGQPVVDKIGAIITDPRTDARRRRSSSSRSASASASPGSRSRRPRRARSRARAGSAPASRTRRRGTAGSRWSWRPTGDERRSAVRSPFEHGAFAPSATGCGSPSP